jgi:hypothetical protein
MLIRRAPDGDFTQAAKNSIDRLALGFAHAPALFAVIFAVPTSTAAASAATRGVGIIRIRIV